MKRWITRLFAGTVFLALVGVILAWATLRGSLPPLDGADLRTVRPRLAMSAARAGDAPLATCRSIKRSACLAPSPQAKREGMRKGSKP